MLGQCACRHRHCAITANHHCTITVPSLQLGFGEEWLDTKLKEGRLFKLAIFPSASADAVPATWEGISGLLESNYPEVWRGALATHWPSIVALNFEDIQAQADYGMREANLTGRYDHTTGESEHPNYMSLQRFERRIRQQQEGGRPVSLVEARQFLFDEIGIRELFKGDGYTYDDEGVRGPREYVARNGKLAEISGAVVIDVVPSRSR